MTQHAPINNLTYDHQPHGTAVRWPHAPALAHINPHAPQETPQTSATEQTLKNEIATAEARLTKAIKELGENPLLKVTLQPLIIVLETELIQLRAELALNER